MDVGSSGSGVAGGSEQPDMVLGSKPGSSGRGQQMCFATNSFLQPLYFGFSKQGLIVVQDSLKVAL